jgi:hypothetical protein
VKFSDGEKLIAIMLADIIEANGKSGEIEPDFVREAITSDHLWALRWKYPGIYHNGGNDPEVVEETAAIMTMCRVIENSINDLDPADREKIPERDRKVFVGFDGNHDDHYGVARMLIEHLDRFEEFKDRGFNSHSTVLPQYRRMMDDYKAAGGAGRSPLPLSEILSVLRIEEPASAA